MAYIIFVNPQIMALSGMDQGAIFVGTCLAAAIACFVMGLFANWPIGLAPGMGLNAFFTYTVVGEMGYSWEVALGAVFLAGVLFFIMSIKFKSMDDIKHSSKSQNCHGCWSGFIYWDYWLKKWWHNFG